MTAPLQLPANLQVETVKITAYLLNLAHVDGRSKAKFFISWGFAASNPDALAYALLAHPIGSAPTSTQTNRYGSSFTFEGPILSPRGPTPDVRTVWEVRTGDAFGRLVTAYPCARGASASPSP